MRKSNWRATRRRRASAIGRARGLASQRVQREKRATREIDPATRRWRSLQDARGQLLRAGCTFTAIGEKHWRTVRSLRGRTDQRDVIVNGQLFKTCGPRRLQAWLRQT